MTLILTWKDGKVHSQGTDENHLPIVRVAAYLFVQASPDGEPRKLGELWPWYTWIGQPQRADHYFRFDIHTKVGEARVFADIKYPSHGCGDTDAEDIRQKAKEVVERVVRALLTGEGK